jgi:hypothetical protein
VWGFKIRLKSILKTQIAWIWLQKKSIGYFWQLKVSKDVPVLNKAPRHEGVIGQWRYSSTHSLTSALDRDEWSASCPGRFTHRERAPGTHWLGGWVGPRAGLDAVVKRKIPSPRRQSNPRTPIVQPVAQRYTDWAITAFSCDSYWMLLLTRNFNSAGAKYHGQRSTAVSRVCTFMLWCNVNVMMNVCNFGSQVMSLFCVEKWKIYWVQNVASNGKNLSWIFATVGHRYKELFRPKGVKIGTVSLHIYTTV